MRLGSITEFGATPQRYQQVLEDLVKSGRRRHKAFPRRQYFLAAFGSTDLVEIATFQHYFHLTQVEGSGAQAFRRSVGVICPDLDELLREARAAGAEAVAPEVVTIGEALRKQPELPFAAVLYAKVGTSASLALAECSLGRPLPWSLVGRVASPASRIWSQYREILDATIDGGASLDLRVAPLIGLDAVEQVLVVRASRLEQIAALSMVVRHQHLETIRAASEAPEGLITMADLVGARRGEARQWNRSPLYDGTSSVVGIPLRLGEGRRGKVWGLETEASAWTLPDPPAAAEGLLLARSRYAPGGFERVLSRAEKEQRRGSGPWDKPMDARGGDGAVRCTMLFDRRDLLWNIKHPKGEALPMPLRVVTRGELADRVRFLSGLPFSPAVPPDYSEALDEIADGRAIATDLSVVVHVPTTIQDALPARDFSETLGERLTDCRREHTRHDLLEGWTRRWLRATKKIGMTYPFTNGGVVLMDSVLGMLSTDFAEFVDLLPALEALVRLAEKLAGPDDDAPAGYSGSPTVWRPNRREARRPRPRELVRMYGMVEELASSRVRRTHPLKRPGAGLAVHGHAGHQLPRDAFVVFVESLARHLGHGGGAILVLDSPGVGLSCEPAPGGAVAIQVSTMALHHPLHWASAHELAHALFEQRSPPPAVTRGCERVDVRLFEAAAELRVASKVELRGADSLAVHLRAMVTDLEDAGAVSTKRDLAAALASLAEEVPADLLLRDSLALPKDSPAQTSARFWFVMGPCLLFDLQDSFGATPLPDVVVQTLLLRFWLVERLVEGQLQPEAWAEGLSMLVETGRRVASPKPGDPPFTEGSFGRLLVSVKEDLGIPNPIWHKALTRFEGLLDDLDSEEELARDLAAVVAAWLKLVQAVRAKLAPALERDEGDPWLGFTRYVQRLMKPCHFSYPTGELAGPVEGDWQVASPWPPFVRDHGHARDSLVTDNQRWTEEGVVISRRGGVMAGRNGQRHYNRMTTDFVLEMDAAVRHSRLDKLLAYLRRPGGEL